MTEIVVCFDIDGTLLTTARAGVAALEDAAAEVCGARPDLTDMKTAGMTDGEIARAVIESCAHGPADGMIEPFLRAYAGRLPARLPERAGSVLPGVRELLTQLAGEPRVSRLLLTGNTRAGAHAKLTHYGLAGLIADGAFCRGGETREAIARRARSLAARELGADPSPKCFVVIGDTPADVRCGLAVGATTIAVASGSHGEQELADAGAGHVVAAMTSVGPLLEELGARA
jgi:phosphoglycolate phosphatase-like HAD superfamily hydrolase